MKIKLKKGAELAYKHLWGSGLSPRDLDELNAGKEIEVDDVSDSIKKMIDIKKAEVKNGD